MRTVSTLHFEHQSQLASLADIYTILEQGAHHYFQPSKQSGSDAFDSYVVTKWKHYHALKLPGAPGLSQFFHKWRHFILFRKMEREQARYTLGLKHQRLNTLVAEAQVAHERHDSFKLYQIINKHCPRVRSKRIHLKGEDGRFLTHGRDCGICTSHCHQLGWS